MRPLRILYRAEGSRLIGTGHVLRAVRLSDAWNAMGLGKVTLALSGDEVGAALAARASATVVSVLGNNPHHGKPVFNPQSLANLGADVRWDVAVIDMLDTYAGTLDMVRSIATTVITLDDRGPGRTDADAIINVLVREPRRDGLPGNVRLLEGPEYATVDRMYAETAPVRTCRTGACKALITLGGADSAGLALKVARAMHGVPDIAEATFICGVGAVHGEELRQALAELPWPTTVVQQVPSLREMLIQCDVAIVAGGLTMHEACCVGTPALAVCQPIDHQMELAEWFRSQGAMDTAGNGVTASVADIRDALIRLIRDCGARRSMSMVGPGLVDGRGTERTARAIADIARQIHQEVNL